MIESILSSWPKQRWGNTRLLLAVSGGADSMALLHAFGRLQPDRDQLAVAHFNHGWRGEDSNADAQFVQAQAEAMGLQFYLGNSEVNANEKYDGPKSEESARSARYDFLVATAYQVGARYVVTAHTSSDRIETTLHNLFRGTGLAGISSLKTFRALDEELVLSRPMLEVPRREVLQYLNQHGLEFREDQSNSDVNYRRNFLRHEVLPRLATQYGDDVGQHVLDFSSILAEFLDLLDELATQYWDRVDAMLAEGIDLGPMSGVCCAFPSDTLEPVSWQVLHRALRRRWQELHWPTGAMTRDHWESLRELHEATAEHNAPMKLRHQLPGTLQVATCKGWIRISER